MKSFMQSAQATFATRLPCRQLGFTLPPTRATAAPPAPRSPHVNYVTRCTHLACVTRTHSTHPACSAPLLPYCQANWLHQIPCNPYLLSSALDTLNCAKMAHSRPPGGYGGGMVGARRGNGGGKVVAPVSSGGVSSVPIWHKTPASLSLSISNRCPKMPCPARPQTLWVAAVGQRWTSMLPVPVVWM